MSNSHPAEWMARGTYGMMVHYLITPPGDNQAEKTDNLNRVVDAFDLEYFIGQLEASGADWLIFTIGQNTGYYCSPNGWLDKAAPGHTSHRDLIAEIAQRVHGLGKRFIAYIPAEVDMTPPEILEVFRWDDDRRPFLEVYLEFLRDYSMRFGALCDGWWFDGCYDHIHKGEWDWSDWVSAAQAGNPASIVAFNDGAFCVGRIKPVSPLQHYHAGEVHILEQSKIRLEFVGGDAVMTPEGRLRRPDQTEVPLYMPDSQYVDGVQWHALVPVDCTFNPAIPDMHYPDEELFRFVLDCKKVGGAVTLNVPLDTSNGHVPDASAGQLARLGDTLRRLAK